MENKECIKLMNDEHRKKVIERFEDLGGVLKVVLPRIGMYCYMDLRKEIHYLDIIPLGYTEIELPEEKKETKLESAIKFLPRIEEMQEVDNNLSIRDAIDLMEYYEKQLSTISTPEDGISTIYKENYLVYQKIKKYIESKHKLIK